jgi:choice-of-anchor B domain-containing protein
MYKYFLLLLINFQVFSTPFTPCDNSTGMAGIFPCQKVDLMKQLPMTEMGGTENTTGNDIWGWTDPETHKEYALMGMSNGTAFVDVTNPKTPKYLGILPSATSNSIWRDIKTYKNYAYIVSEAFAHGLQVFDLTQLRDIAQPPIEFTATLRYREFTHAHNIIINESTGFAYAVGTNTCNGGLHMMSLEDPANPTFVGCFSADGETHDAQCVTYIGPDVEHENQEICFNSNQDTITIVNVTDKNAPQQISRNSYDNFGFVHQGWLTEDQRYFLSDDELDEENFGHKTRTYIWDMLDLEAPVLMGYYQGPKDSIDHNIYIKGKLAYLTNYSSGLSIVDITDIENANLKEVANFDSFPAHDMATFDGAWSNYPYFASGNIILSDFDKGLFILSPTICSNEVANSNSLPEYCQATVKKTIQPGLWFDPSHNGHGFAIEPIKDSNLFFTLFYTYKDDGTSEWYSSLSSLEDGILNINMDDDTLLKSTYDFSIDPTGASTPLVIDNSIGTNKLSINFNSDQFNSNNQCQQQVASNPNTALATWQLGEQTGNWCIVPLIKKENYPTPDYGATWWATVDDDGWGISLAFSHDTIVVLVYYYDVNGQPRWVLGQTAGFQIDQEITVALQEFNGYARLADPKAVDATDAGNITLKLNATDNSIPQDGTISLDINYQGDEGGAWQRNNIPITIFTNPH